MLEKIYGQALMATDRIYEHFNIYNNGLVELREYILMLLALRAKIYEYAGVEDMNDHINKQIEEKLRG